MANIGLDNDRPSKGLRRQQDRVKGVLGRKQLSLGSIGHLRHKIISLGA